MATVTEIPNHDRTATGALPPALRAFELWTLLLFAVSMLYHFVESVIRHVGGFQGSPLSAAGAHFEDFTIFTNKFQYFGTARFFQTGFPINYPAPCAVFIEAFFKLAPGYALGAFLGFSLLAIVLPAVLLGRLLHRRGISATRSAVFMTVITACSWPVVLLLDRANVEVLVFVTLSIAMWAYATGRAWLAAAFFGIGASVKLFPFVLLGLYVSRRQWGKVLFGAAVFFAISIGSLAILGPTIPIAFSGLLAGMDSFKRNYMAEWRMNENGVDHSMFALYKGVLYTCFHHGAAFPNALGVYLLLTAVVGVALYVFRIRFLPLLNQVLILTIASIYFTAFSGDGTLIHLYAPLFMMFLLAIQAYREGVKVPGLRLMLNCLVFILSFLSLFVYHTHRFSGPAKCIAIGILLIAALKYPLGPPLADTTSETILAHPNLDWLRSSGEV